MPLFNRFRRGSGHTATSTKRDWHDYLTLSVGIAGFILLVVATVITQVNQISANRDTAEALNRFGTIADSSKAEVETLRDQARAAVLAAEAARSQAKTAQAQVAALERSLQISQQSAAAANRLTIIAAKNLRSENFFRDRTLAASLPLLIADATVVTDADMASDGKPLYLLRVSLRNTGRTAAFVRHMIAYTKIGDLPREVQLPFEETIPLNITIPSGDTWNVPPFPIDMGPHMYRIRNGERFSQALFFTVDDYFRKTQITCFAFSVDLREGFRDPIGGDCPKPIPVVYTNEPESTKTREGRKR